SGLGAADLADDVHAAVDLSEYRVLVVEVRRGSQRDEELPTVGVGPRVRHGQDAGFAVAEAWMELVGELVAGSADTLPERVAALDHETVDHAMKDDAVVVRLLDLLVSARVGPLLRPLGQADEVG